MVGFKLLWLRVVPHTGFEPVISALRGRCPRPLDECGTGVGRGKGPPRTVGMIPAGRESLQPWVAGTT